ncbi:hypothetical protein [Caldithrix abyssi]|uniref:Uncharacterized protein n=1 Tax=Caldithrix abyssi DSM 13497 TaxID=880073 RepID=A0A1J1C3L3_CALAY|nr:hypothetical protein [Caldithrix abyssi]APF16881.1 hypothetical protein Cabys_130 [Caldithrix abyssi DSM 13497]
MKPYSEAYFSINVEWIASKRIEDDENGNWYYDTEYYLKSYNIN